MTDPNKAIEMMQDDFDSILDSCLADIARGRATIETCLQRYPAHAGQLAVLLQMAERAQTSLPPARLPDDRRRMLESRLLRQAGQIQPRPVSQPVAARPVMWRRAFAWFGAARPVMWRRGFAWFGAAVIVVFLLVSTAVSASAASVPGEFLYPVKRATERVRLTLAPPEAQVDLHLEFARQRLQELQVVDDRGVVSEGLLTEISAETAQVLNEIPALPRGRQRAELESLTAFQDQHLKTLEIMAASAHGNAQTKVMAEMADVTAQRQQALGLLTGTASDSSPANDSAGTPQPTTLIEETPPAQGGATGLPGLIGTIQPGDGGEATDTSGATPQDTATDSEHTPPGQIKQATPHVPPGQARPATPHAPSPKLTKTPKK